MVYIKDQARCPDCAVEVGHHHEPGCDVARCKRCGRQELSCEHAVMPMTRWTGLWPGDVEVAEGLAADLVDLYVEQSYGRLVWDITAERWRAAE